MRQNFVDGVELTKDDLNRISSRLERQLYDRIALGLVQFKPDRFFGDSFKVLYVDASNVSVLPGAGFQQDLTAPAYEPTMRLLFRAAPVAKALSAPHSTFNRKDLVCVRASRADTATGTRKVKDLGSGDITSETVVVETDWQADVIVVTGAATLTPAEPDVPSGYIKVASILVKALTGLASQADITDTREQLAFGPMMEIDTTGYTVLTAAEDRRLKDVLAQIDTKLAASATEDLSIRAAFAAADTTLSSTLTTAYGAADTTLSTSLQAMMPPVRSIIAYHPGYYTGAANTGFVRNGPTANTVAGVNALLPANWRVCDGTEYLDAASPVFDGAGRYLPDLTDSRFLGGETAAGTSGGNNAMSHTHSVTSNVAVSDHTVTWPSYTVPAHTHGNGTISVSSSGQHSHSGTTNAGGDGHSDNKETTGGGPGTSTVAGYVNNSTGSHSHGWSISSSGAHTHANAVIAGSVGSGSSDGDATFSTTRSGGSLTSHSVTNNAVTSGAASNTENRPSYLSVFYIMRVK